MGDVPSHNTPFLAKLSNIICHTQTGCDATLTDLPFGGLNIIMVGNFHQFPPMATKASAPIIWPCNVENNMHEELVRCHIYEQFDIVIHLKTQVRVTDVGWCDLLHHICNGSCSKHEINMLWGLVLENPTCPLMDFSTLPWKDAVLVTPQHAM
ncbi:hypothetical protein M404DRAFT_150174 [Pisolithus tinctorius Marx 270]|uniref:DNA helicase n=1 Tax=Pisolithus tinctorius Marx 270 TaxID=870435 RepID=A0A0C3P2F1_PISTI|nr:hypothetical protein M404DRAFT_150174 [Pisolithus tinctorius Marx 270]